MPISVSCPSCSAGFKVKDEYAGKRAKCPKCAAPLTIPAMVDTVLMPPPPKAPVAARPVVASKPKPVPVDDDADEPVRPKRKRGADDDDNPQAKKRAKDDEEDDNPRSRKGKDEGDEGTEPKSRRKRGDDTDDDTPRSKRRRGDDDDDEPKKKSKALPIILGIVGGLLLLCGGGCAGVWFGVIVPAAEKAKRMNDEKEAELKKWTDELNKPGPNPQGGGDPVVGNKATQENMNKLRAGMTLAQVEETVGKGKAADDFDLLRGIQGNAGDAQWQAKQKANAVYSFGGGISDVLLVAFSAPPASGGTVVGVRGGFGANTFEPIKLAGGGGGSPTVPTTPNTGPTPSTPAVAITADALAKEFDANPQAAEAKYKGKELKVTGVAADIPKDAVNFTMAGASPPTTKAAIVIPVIPKFGAWGPIKKMKVGDTATVTGKFESFAKGKNNAWEIRLTDCTIGR